MTLSHRSSLQVWKIVSCFKSMFDYEEMTNIYVSVRDRQKFPKEINSIELDNFDRDFGM